MGNLKRFSHVKVMVSSSYICTTSLVSSEDCCNVGQAIDHFVNAIHQPTKNVLIETRKPGRKHDHVKHYSKAGGARYCLTTVNIFYEGPWIERCTDSNVNPKMDDASPVTCTDPL
jgi:hypothetical protein